ncbi:MAG: hypothetical protein AB7G37_06530 [Solirubrobacteraceae bacterium]
MSRRPGLLAGLGATLRAVSTLRAAPTLVVTATLLVAAILLVAAALSVAVPSAASAQGAWANQEPPAANASTPDGPATLHDVFTGPVPAIALPPAVLLGARVAVGPGGREGMVRVRVQAAPGLGPPEKEHRVGPWTRLPAEPGVYRLPAPRVAWQTLGSRLAIDQRTGGHRILRSHACSPEQDRWGDLCQVQAVRVFTPILPDSGPYGTPTAYLAGHELTVRAVTETDADGDLRGDETEEGTDLRVTVRRQRLRDGRVRLRITVRNRGPLRVDRPRVQIATAALRGRWSKGCRSQLRSEGRRNARTRLVPVTTRCHIAALPAGARRSVTHTLDRPRRRTTVRVRVIGDAPNLVRRTGVDRRTLRVGRRP